MKHDRKMKDNEKKQEYIFYKLIQIYNKYIYCIIFVLLYLFHNYLNLNKFNQVEETRYLK